MDVSRGGHRGNPQVHGEVPSECLFLDKAQVQTGPGAKHNGKHNGMLLP